MFKAAWIVSLVVLGIVGTLQASIGDEAMRVNQPGVIIVPTSDRLDSGSSLDISVMPTFGSDSEQLTQVVGGVLTTKCSCLQIR